MWATVTRKGKRKRLVRLCDGLEALQDAIGLGGQWRRTSKPLRCKIPAPIRLTRMAPDWVTTGTPACNESWQGTAWRKQTRISSTGNYVANLRWVWCQCCMANNMDKQSSDHWQSACKGQRQISLATTGMIVPRRPSILKQDTSPSSGVPVRTLVGRATPASV
jgi:hypothetical protein